MLSEKHQRQLANRPLGVWLGSRDPAHLSRWRAALKAGYLAGPRCEGTTRLGQRCQRLPLYGASRCCAHLKGPERDKVDQVRLTRLHKQTLHGSVGERQRALRQIGNIERRLLRGRWRKDPTIPAATIILTAVEERRAREYLLRFGLDIEAADLETGELLTPCARDAARWAAQRGLAGFAEDRKVRQRITSLLRDERKYWARQANSNSRP